MSLLGVYLGVPIGLIMGIILSVVLSQIKRAEASEDFRKFLIKILFSLPGLWLGGIVGETIYGHLGNNLEEVLPMYLAYSAGVFVLTSIWSIIGYIGDSASKHKVEDSKNNG